MGLVTDKTEDFWFRVNYILACDFGVSMRASNTGPIVRASVGICPSDTEQSVVDRYVEWLTRPEKARA